jgi:hypothetical protein
MSVHLSVTIPHFPNQEQSMAMMLRKLFTFFLAFGLAGSLLAEVSLRDRMASERATAAGYSAMAKAAQKQAPKLLRRLSRKTRPMLWPRPAWRTRSA